MNSNEPAPNGGSAIDLGTEGEFTLGSLLVRPASREIVSGGQTEMIEPRVMQALVALARRPNQVVTRDQLLDACWSSRVVSDDAVTRCIAKVRRLASPTTFELETIPRVGYRLTVSPVAVPSPKSVDQTDTDTDREAPIAKPKRRRAWVIAACILGVVSLAGAYWAWRGMQSLGATSFAEMGDLFFKEGKPSFAVLPFDVRSKDPDADYLADAIPAAINNQLIALGFQVVSPAVAFQYRGERKALAGPELKSRYLIDGAVRVEGKTLSVTARVDSTAQPVSVWTQDFTVDMHEASTLPNRIAVALAALPIFKKSAPMGIESAPRVTTGYLRLSELMRVGDDMNAYLVSQELMLETPHAFVTQATNASAVAGALDLLPLSERAATVAKARAAANEAAFISPTGAPMGQYSLIPAVDWAAREHVLKAGLEAQHPVGSIRFTLAGLLTNAGRVTEAAAMARQATVIDPLASTNLLTYAIALDMSGKYEEADSLFARAERLWPGLESVELVRFFTAIARDDVSAAKAMLHDPSLKPVIDPPAERQPYAAILQALTTHAPADTATVEQDCADPDKLARKRNGPCLLALIKLKRLDAFFSAASLYFPDQRANTPEERDSRWFANPLAWRNLRILFRKDVAAIRADERFIPIVERMGLLDYWRVSGKWPDFCETEPNSVCGRMQGR